MVKSETFLWNYSNHTPYNTVNQENLRMQFLNVIFKKKKKNKKKVWKERIFKNVFFYCFVTNKHIFTNIKVLVHI